MWEGTLGLGWMFLAACSAAVMRLSLWLPCMLMGCLWVFIGNSCSFVNLVYISNRCGKTTICQLFAALANQKLYSVNCHLHMETSDFLGGLRPVRQKQSDKVCSMTNIDVCIHLKNCSSLCPCGILLVVGFLDPSFGLIVEEYIS